MWLTVLDKMQNVSDYQQHQLLSGFFEAYDKRPFCFRDTGEHIVLLSNQKPKTECREITFSDGQALLFECRASVRGRSCAGVKIKPEQYTAKHLKEWFVRRLLPAANVQYVTFKKMSPHKILRNDGRLMILNQTLFYGTLIVNDAKAFDELVGHGIGAGGAFGFGALILPQVMS